MICVVSLIVFSVLGIFSAKYRKLAKQAFECVTNKGTGNPCDVNFDRKIRNKVITKALNIDTRLASFIQSYFALISAIFLLLLIGSFIASSIGIYNWLIHGNCQGAQATTGCTLNQGAGLLEQTWDVVCFWKD